MDLDAIRKKLEQLNSAQTNSNDFAKNFWKPPMGKSTVRIVPSAYNKDNPFTELYFHTVFSKYPILALTNFGQKDPVEEFRALLQAQGGKENWSLSGKLTPRPNYYVPVIVRGEEKEGVRLWRIGVTIYKALLGYAADEEIGDYTDIAEGRDLKITKVEGNPYPEISVTPSVKVTPLSTDSKQVEEWLKNQPEPIKCFRQQSFDQIKAQLEAFMRGKPAEVPAEAISNKEEPVEKKEIVEEKPKTKKPAKSITQKFDDLFDTGEGTETGSEDDLPF